MSQSKPVIGILPGDAAGVGPEIVAKLAANGFLTGLCRPVIIGDERVFANALKIIGKTVKYGVISHVAEADWTKGIMLLDQKDQDPAQIEPGKASAYTGRADVAMLLAACRLCKEKKIEGFCFAPVNKAAMHEGGLPFESEQHLIADAFGVTGPFGEVNMLENLYTTRATSHVPLGDIRSHLTVEAILRAMRLAHSTIAASGVPHPRLGVAGLNPHCGENGSCGREEIDVIAPAIAKAREIGLTAEGPYAADTIFVRAFKGDFDGVVTMYHDQGQIALKVKGFEKGITFFGGQPYPIATCAHGTANDIAGKGIASTSSFEKAVSMVSKMAAFLSGKK